MIVPTPVVAFAEFALAGIDPSSREPARPGLAETRTEPADDGFDHLFGSTVYRSVEDAAVREVVEDPIAVGQSGINNGALDFRHSSGEAWSSRLLGDHDGSTIMASELAALRQVPSVDQSSTPAAHRRRPPDHHWQSWCCPPASRSPLIEGWSSDGDRRSIGWPVARFLGWSRSRVRSRTFPGRTCGSPGRPKRYVATDLHSMNGTVVIGVGRCVGDARRR